MEQGKIKEIFIDMLAQGHSVNVTANGLSMVPFIWPKATLHVVPCSPRDLRPGDVALFDRPGEILVAHRVVAQADGAVVFRGDSCLFADGAIADSRIVGRVDTVSWGFLSYPMHGFRFRIYKAALTRLAPVSYLFNNALAWCLSKMIRVRSLFRNLLQ